MTTASDSEILTRVGPGTLLGNMMREYWIPAAKSSEVVAGGEPLKLMLLGEKLIAFRDETTGRVGVMDQRCPHRCATAHRASSGSSPALRSSVRITPNEIDRSHKMELYSILWSAVEARPRIWSSNRRGDAPLYYAGARRWPQQSRATN